MSDIKRTDASLSSPRHSSHTGPATETLQPAAIPGGHAETAAVVEPKDGCEAATPVTAPDSQAQKPAPMGAALSQPSAAKSQPASQTVGHVPAALEDSSILNEPGKAAPAEKTDAPAPLDTPVELQGAGHSFTKSSRRAGTYELRYHDPNTNQPVTYTITVHPESRVPNTMAAMIQFGESMKKMVEKAQTTEPNFRSLQWHNIDDNPRCLLTDKDGKESKKPLDYDIKTYLSDLGKGSVYFQQGPSKPGPNETHSPAQETKQPEKDDHQEVAPEGLRPDDAQTETTTHRETEEGVRHAKKNANKKHAGDSHTAATQTEAAATSA